MIRSYLVLTKIRFTSGNATGLKIQRIQELGLQIPVASRNFMRIMSISGGTEYSSTEINYNIGGNSSYNSGGEDANKSGQKVYSSDGASGQIIGEPTPNYMGVAGLTINNYYGYCTPEGVGGVVIDLSYTNIKASKAQWLQRYRTNAPSQGTGYGTATSDWDYTEGEDNYPFYYSKQDGRDHINGNTNSFYDNPPSSGICNNH